MSLNDEKWPLWSKKKSTKTWEIRHEAIFICMEILELKIWWQHILWLWGKIGIIYEVHFRHTIYFFEVREVRNPTLQTMWKSELKWRSYDHLKTTSQSWRTISKFNLWIWNPTYEFKIQFEMNPISNSPTTTLMFHLLYLKNCI